MEIAVSSKFEEKDLREAKQKKHILMVLANPFIHDARVYNEALSLVKGGYEVTIISWDRKGENPPKETKDGIRIVRVRNTTFMKAIPYDIFRMRFWWKEAYKNALEIHKNEPIEVVHCHDLDSLPTGVMLKRKLDLPLIYDAHEIWGYMVARDLPRFWANSYIKKEKRLIKNVNRAITVSNPLKKYLNKISKVPVTIIMNCKRIQNKMYKPPKNEIFTIFYAGMLNKQHFILELIEVIKGLDKVHLILGGMGKAEYVDAVRKECSKTKNIDFIGAVPLEKVLPMTKEADILFHMVDPTDLNNRFGTGNKLFESMICGRPIICTKGANDGSIIENIGCGLAVEYKIESLRNAIIKLRDNPDLVEELGRRGLEAALKQYNWEEQEVKLLNVYRNIN